MFNEPRVGITVPTPIYPMRSHCPNPR